jgi:hypothetical protein
MQNSNELKDNPNFKALETAYEKLKTLEQKANQAILAGVPNANAERALSASYSELRSLHSEYSALLDWLQQPENSGALQAFGEHSACKFLNSFFSA